MPYPEALNSFKLDAPDPLADPAPETGGGDRLTNPLLRECANWNQFIVFDVDQCNRWRQRTRHEKGSKRVNIHNASEAYAIALVQRRKTCTSIFSILAKLTEGVWSPS